MLFYILLELENDVGQVEMCFFYRWFSSPKVKNNWIILERNLCWWFSVHWEKDFIWNFQIKVEIIHFKITVHILSYSQQEPVAAAKSPVQVPPQQFSNFSLNASTWSPNKHNIQEMANFHRQANYQKFINNGINGFSSNNFNTTSSQPPHFHPSHEQYFSYMANSGPVTNELSRHRIVDSSAMMC